MRVFIDCTHTANHTYKNTGIHRVVRQITTELIELSIDNPSLEVIPVKFDSTFITGVSSLDEQNANSISQQGKQISSDENLVPANSNF